MISREVGNYDWRQLSMWDFAPKPCIEKYVRNGDHVFHFYLTRIVEITSPNRWRTEVVTSAEGVPDEVLKCSPYEEIVVAGQ